MAEDTHALFEVQTGTEHLDETELCAHESGCHRAASAGRDLCHRHYSMEHRNNCWLPPVAVYPGRHDIRDPRGDRGDCTICGPGVRVRYRRNWTSPYCVYKTQAYMRWREYGLTEEQYDLRLIALGNRCALCGGAPGEAGLFVDHSHETGQPRDLLCHPCNQTLGFIEKCRVPIENLLIYLERQADHSSF